MDMRRNLQDDSDIDTRSRVLIVDDAPENIRILSEVLKEKYIVMFACNGKDALRLAQGLPAPDIILLDVIMPEMNGYEVCLGLKTSPITNHIPVLFITAQNDETEEAHGLTLGAVDYISKPFRSSLVTTRVENQLELKRYRDRLNDLVHERTRELSLTHEVTIEAMATLAEWRDPETGAHIRRTQLYVQALAEHLAKSPKYAAELTREVREMLYLSAPLHDVGKISISDNVLRKPDRLTPEEFDEIKQHTTRGKDILAASEKKLGKDSFLSIARTIAHSHHERWDGKGYPQGLVGEEIPLSAQIMSVADVYDALRSHRVYKPVMPHKDVRALIFEGRGTQFAPDVVDAFMALDAEFIRIAQEFADSEPIITA